MSENPFAPGDNPYQSPNIVTSASDIGDADGSLDRAANMLRQTKPWVRFISVMFFLGAVFLALAGLVMMAGGMADAMGPWLWASFEACEVPHSATTRNPMSLAPALMLAIISRCGLRPPIADGVALERWACWCLRRRDALRPCRVTSGS